MHRWRLLGTLGVTPKLKMSTQDLYKTDSELLTEKAFPTQARVQATELEILSFLTDRQSYLAYTGRRLGGSEHVGTEPLFIINGKIIQPVTFSAVMFVVSC
jgi:hypothetical protein